MALATVAALTVLTEQIHQEASMPGILKHDFKHIEVKELHPTFAAEIEGVDFGNITDDVFAEILAASAKVRTIE